MKTERKDKGDRKDTNETLLLKGAHLRVVSAGTEDEPLETVGELLAFTPMGHGGAEGIVIAPEKGGRKRIIPLGSVLYIEMVKEAPESKEPVEETTAPFYT